MRTHDIAVIPGDGIGLEVTPAALEVLEAAGRAHGFSLRLTEHPWGCDYFVEHGRMMPPDALETLSEVRYDRWRDYDPEDSMRFYALRLHEVGMVSSNPNEILAEGTDWRFLNELKRELKA